MFFISLQIMIFTSEYVFKNLSDIKKYFWLFIEADTLPFLIRSQLLWKQNCIKKHKIYTLSLKHRLVWSCLLLTKVVSCPLSQASVWLPAQHLRPVMWSLLPRFQPVSMETSYYLQCQWMWTWVLQSLSSEPTNQIKYLMGIYLTHSSNEMSFHVRGDDLSFLTQQQHFMYFKVHKWMTAMSVTSWSSETLWKALYYLFEFWEYLICLFITYFL